MEPPVNFFHLLDSNDLAKLKLKAFSEDLSG
jgi:hypothetical protein